MSSRPTTLERDEVRLNGRGGFAFLLAFGGAWLASAVLALLLPLNTASLVFLFQGAVATPLAFVLEKAFGFPPVSRENSLTPLLIGTAMSQLPALLAVVLVYNLDAHYVPAALAAIVGGHFLPYAWIHRTRLFVALAIITAVVPFALAAIFGEASFYFVGFAVGATLLVAAFVLRARVEKELAGLPVA